MLKRPWHLLIVVSLTMLVASCSFEPSEQAGARLLKEGKYEEAIQAYDRALEIDDKNPDFYNNRAVCNRLLHRYNPALRDYDKAIELSPEMAPAYMGRGAVHLARKELKPALSDMNKAASLQPADAAVLCLRSQIFLAMHSPRSAQKDIEAALKIAPNNPSIWAAKAAFLSTGKHFQNSIDCCTHALGLDPNCSVAYEQRAYDYMALKKYQPAINDYTEAIVRDQRNAEALYNRGLAYEQQGKLERAYQDHQAALDIDPDFKSAESRLAYLAFKVDPPDDGKAHVRPKCRPLSDKWALCVGVAKFKDKKIHYTSAAKDAKDFAKYLTSRGNFAKDHVHLLTDSAATKIHVKEEVEGFLGKMARPDDLVVVFLASHGSEGEGENYILLHDYDAYNADATGLRMQSLMSSLKKRVRCDRIIIVLECCFAGATELATSSVIGGRQNHQQVLQGTGQMVICSSGPGQSTWDSGRYSNGVFTHRLLEGLNRQGSSTTIENAFQYAQRMTCREVQEDDHTYQLPVLYTAWSGADLVPALPPVHPRAVKDASVTVSTVRPVHVHTHADSVAHTD